MFTDLENYFTTGGSTSEADEHTIYTDNGAGYSRIQLRYGIAMEICIKWIIYDQTR